MSQILVDSSIWISFFKGSIDQDPFFTLIDANQLCINDLILSELVPSLIFTKERKLIEILHQISRSPLNIDWNALIEYQARNLSKGINHVGVPDLMIMQNAIQNNFKLYSLDSLFKQMSKIFPLQLYA
jgi:predicted nucleic acid-binding protein